MTKAEVPASGAPSVVGGSQSLRQRAAEIELFPAEKRIAAELLAIPPYELGAMTSSDLSERSGASRSSIDRLSRKLGYAGLKEMRRAILLDAAATLEPKETAGHNSVSEIARQVAASLTARTGAMVTSLSSSSHFDKLLAAMLSARHIRLFGAGESAAACTAIYMRLIRTGLSIQFSEEHHTQVTMACLMEPGDVAIAISHSGGTASTLWAADCAKKSGATLAVLTGVLTSKLARKSDILIDLPTGALPGSGEIIDRIVVVMLAEIMFQCLVKTSQALLSNSLRVDDLFGEQRA